MRKQNRKQAARITLILLLLSLIPFNLLPITQALVWDTTVVYNCNNEYYRPTTPLTVDNISISTNWFNVNGIGWNTTAPNPVYINFTTIKSYPKTSTGYIMNFTETHAVGATQYIINGLKPSYAYIWITNSTDYPQTSSATGTLYLNQTGTSRNHKLYDPGIPVGWYVATTGSDTTGTGTFANPFKTLRKALNTSTTGDTITMRGGNYDRPGFGSLNYMVVNRSHITIRNYTSEKVVIDGKYYTIPAGQAMFRLYTYATTYWNNITFYGINFSNCSLNAIYAHAYPGKDSNSNITISHCDFFNITERAIWIYSEETINTIYNQYWSIDNCTFNYIQNNASMHECIVWMKVKNSRYENNTLKNFTKQGLSLSAGSTQNIIQYNTFENKYYFALKLSGESAVDRNVSWNIIRNNYFTGYSKGTGAIERGISLNPEQNNNHVHNNSIYNNVFYISVIAGQSSFPIHILGAAGKTGQRINHNIITYNTVFITGGTSTCKAISATTGPATCTGNIIANNIFVTEQSGNQIIFPDLTKAQTSFTLRNNLYMYTSGTTLGASFTDDASEFETGAVSGDPDFVDNSTGNLNINITSPAIGAATATYTTPYDYAGTARPQGATYDIGAYERAGGGGTAYAPVQTTPVPTNGTTVTLPLAYLNITATDQNADTMNIYFYSNYTGAWILLSSNLTVTNGTYQSLLPGITGTGWRYWRVSVTDSTVWTNATYRFYVSTPTENIVIHRIRANWTTNTAINITWTKGANCTNTYIYRSETGYMNIPSLIYSGTLSYYNDTLKNPAIRYYYTLYPYNSVSSLYGTPVNAILAETDNATTYGSTWLNFPGYLATDKSVKANYHYSTETGFGSTTINITGLDYSYNGTATSTYAGQYYNLLWFGQTFKTGTQKQYIYNVSIHGYRVGSPGLLYCRLYSANATGLPAGAALASGSKDITSIVVWPDKQWLTIEMSAYLMNSNTIYAIMFGLSGSSGNSMVPYWDNAAPGYTNGIFTFSTTGGATFGNTTGYDLLFRINTKTPYTYPLGGLITTNSTITTSTTYSITQNDLSEGQLYYYYAAANDTKGNMTKGNNRYSLTRPGVPVFTNIIPNFGNSSVNISWITGVGANRTVLVYSNAAYPTTPAGGTVAYNGTGSYDIVPSILFNTTYYFTMFSFTVWGGLSRFSSGVTIPWGGVTFIVRNESKPWQLINATITVTDSQGLHPTQFTSTYGYYSFNISSIPYGTNTLFYVQNTSYDSRLYPVTIIPNLFYNLTFYLPPLVLPGNGTTGWNETKSYMVQIQTIIVGPAYEQVVTVDGALVRFYRYMNHTGNYSYIGGFITDGNGQGSISLFPYQLYMIKISCDGYENKTDFWTPNVVEQGLIKVFKITGSLNQTMPPVYDDFWTTITFTATMNETNVTMVVYYDPTGNTINTSVYFYEFHMGVLTFITSDLRVGDNDFSFNVTGLNNTRMYLIVLRFNTSNDFQIPNNKVIITVNPLYPWPRHSFDLEQRIVDVIGDFKVNGVVYSWIGFFLSLIPIIVLTLFDPAHAGIGIFTSGFTLVGIQIVLFAWTTNAPPPLIIILIPVIFVIGLLYMLNQRGYL